MANIREAVVVSYGRSPVAKSGKGSFKNTNPIDYAAQTLNGVLKRVPQLNPTEIGDLIVGCAFPKRKQDNNIARLIAQRARLPDEITGQTVNRFCSSGLQTIATAANAIMCGQEDVIVAGGVESMSMVSMAFDPDTYNSWLNENIPGTYMSMGITAENVASLYGITCFEMEQMAVESNWKAAAAQDSGFFEEEIVPITILDDNGAEIIITKDECIRKNTTLEGLAGLIPCFKKGGLVTAATSSQTSDGAAFVVLMSREKAESLNIKPIARFVAYSTGGVPASLMGLGPIAAVPKVLKKTGLTINDFDIIEINEAFAAQAIPCIRVLEMDLAKVNPNGGAIALGHPLGATGAVLTCKALSHLKKSGGKYALITMCIGGGMGAAGIFEMIWEN